VQANLSGQARSALHAVLTSVGTSTTDFLDLGADIGIKCEVDL